MILIVLILMILIIYLLYKSKHLDKFIIYTQKMGSTGSLNVSESYLYPNCYTGQPPLNLGCMNEDGSLITGFNYLTQDGRCFKSTRDIPYSYLHQAYNKSVDLDLSKYFTECGNGQSMFIPTIGRFIRIQRNGDTNPISLTQFEAYTSTMMGTLTYVQPIDIHFSPHISGQNYSSLINKDNIASVSTGNGTIISPAYIQLDLGSNILISQIKLLKHINDPNALNLKNSTLYLIEANNDGLGKIKFWTRIDDSTIGITT